MKDDDHAHQGRHQPLSPWVEGAIGVELCVDLHTSRAAYVREVKHRATRVPRSNGATWPVFRKGGPMHGDVDRLYDRQGAHARKGAA